MSAEEAKKKVEESKKKERPEEAKEAKSEEGRPKPKTSKKIEGLLKTIEEMTVLELSDLVKVLEDKFGVTAAQPVVAAGVAQAGGAAQAGAQEEQAAFTIVLADIGKNKIQVIKEIRAITTLGLKEAKDLVESAPKPVKEDVSKEEADKIKQKLESVGAKVELK